MHRGIVRNSNLGKKPKRCRFSYPDSSRFTQKGGLAREGEGAEEEVEDEEEEEGEETDREEKHREIGHCRRSEVSVVAASLFVLGEAGSNRK